MLVVGLLQVKKISKLNNFFCDILNFYRYNISLQVNRDPLIITQFKYKGCKIISCNNNPNI